MSIFNSILFFLSSQTVLSTQITVRETKVILEKVQDQEGQGLDHVIGHVLKIGTHGDLINNLIHVTKGLSTVITGHDLVT